MKYVGTCSLIVVMSTATFFSGWTDVLRLSRWFVPASISEALLIVVAVSFLLVAERGRIRLQDAFYVGFLLLAILAAAVNPNAKTLPYLAVYVFAFGGMGIVVRMAFESQRDASHLILNANAIAVLLIALVGLIEFWGRWYLGYSIQAFIPRGNVARAGIYMFPRIYGFSEEPTYLSWYLNTMGAIAIFQIWRWRIWTTSRAILSAVVVTAAVMTFSLAGLLGAIVAAIIVLTVAALRHREVMQHLKAIVSGALQMGLAVAVLVLISTALPPQVFSSSRDAVAEMGVVPEAYQDAPLVVQTARETVAAGLTDKLLGETVDPRQDRWTRDIERALAKPVLGWGPGFISSIGEESSNNLPIFLAAETGIPATLVLLLGVAWVFWKIVTCRDPRSLVWLFAFVAGWFHLLSMSQFFHPCIWLVQATFFMMFGADIGDPLFRRRGMTEQQPIERGRPVSSG